MEHQLHLLFAVENPDSEATVAVKALVTELNRERAWTSGELAFVDEIDAASGTQPDDRAVRTLGGALPLTKATGNPHKEREQLADVEFLVERLCRFTVDGPTLVVEYDGEEVGAIAAGRADRSLRQGLLGEWQKGLRDA